MELDHFHVNHLCSRTEEKRDAVCGFVQRGGKKLVHGGPSARADQGGPGMSNCKLSLPHVQEQGAYNPIPLFIPEKIQSAVLFQVFNRLPVEDLFGQAGDDLNPGKISFMDGTVKALASKRFLMDCSIRVSVEETSVFRLHLFDPLRGHSY